MVEPEVSNIKPKSYSASEYEINQLQDILINSSFDEKKLKKFPKKILKTEKNKNSFKFEQNEMILKLKLEQNDNLYLLRVNKRYRSRESFVRTRENNIHILKNMIL